MVTAEAATELRERPERWLLAALLVLAMVICYAHRGALAVVAPFIRTQLGLSRADMGLALAAFFWSYSLLQMPAGWFVDRFGVRLGYVCGFVLWSFALLLSGFAESFYVMLGLCVVFGVVESSSFSV